MAQSFLLLFEDSQTNRLTADIFPVPFDSDPRAHINTMRTKLFESTSKGRRFFNKYVLLQKPSAWVATLRPATVRDLTAITHLRALIKDTTFDEALSEALNDPDSSGHAFYKHMYGLYKDVIFDFDEKNNTIALPQEALLVRYYTSSRVKRAVAGIGSAAVSLVVTVIGGEMY
ncbi:uncharacterized protein BDZ83DRAFT_784005 [Colletotrichum acutatum]|uniref:Uncharacterized protein n=1 Tax=Glomerella acutata TaxID=27357 RepID=A0AAD8UIM4_GLOAC|nr:uncharacterized protein BDZ83DRAFT_784005 [Colletotrichum acutatum]KAK1722375.1 hypothetical protein BDZ83DRAFT_784005 [Colletotrichum acutatum]